MIKPEIGEDITDEKLIKLLKLFVDNYEEYLECNILPEVISYNYLYISY